MRKVLLFLLLCSIAQAASVTFSWDYPKPSPDIEFAVEEKVSGSFKEVATTQGPAYTFDGVPFGTHTYRVRARSISDPTNASEYSNEATATVKISAPTNAKVSVTVTVSYAEKK